MQAAHYSDPVSSTRSEQAAIPDIKLRVGEISTVILPEAASGGYLWDLSALHPIARLVRTNATEENDTTDLATGNDRLVLIIEGIAPGMTRIIHARPWEGAQTNSRAVRITVRRN